MAQYVWSAHWTLYCLCWFEGRMLVAKACFQSGWEQIICSKSFAQSPFDSKGSERLHHNIIISSDILLAMKVNGLRDARVPIGVLLPHECYIAWPFVMVLITVFSLFSSETYPLRRLLGSGAMWNLWGLGKTIPIWMTLVLQTTPSLWGFSSMQMEQSFTGTTSVFAIHGPLFLQVLVSSLMWCFTAFLCCSSMNGICSKKTLLDL